MVGDAWRQLWRHGWKQEWFSRGVRSALALAAFCLTLLGALGERYRAMAFATLILSIYAALAAQPQGRPMAQGQVLLLLAGEALPDAQRVLQAQLLLALRLLPPLRDHAAALVAPRRQASFLPGGAMLGETPFGS